MRKCEYCGNELIRRQKNFCSNECKGHINGKKAAITNKKNKTSFCFDKKLQSKGGKLGGKIGAMVNKQNGTGCFFNKELQSRAGKLAQKTLRKLNIGAFHDPKIRKMNIEINRINRTGIFDPSVQSKANKGKKYPRDLYPNYGIRAIRERIVLPKKDTSIELKIQNFLRQLKIEFLTHQYMHLEHGYQCDILIPKMNLIIECFGDYWHKYPIGREVDSIRCQELRDKGYRVLVFWEREIRVMELEDLEGKLGELEEAN